MIYPQFYFSGKWSSDFDWLIVNDITSSVLPDIENKSVSVPGRAGLYLFGKNRAARIESIRISIIASDRADRESKRKILAGWLDTDEAQTLKFNYRDDEYLAILDGSTELERIASHGATTLNFLIPDPDSLGETHSQTISGARVSRTEDTAEEWEEGTLSDIEIVSNALQLPKAGTDYSGSVDTGWEGGTHHNTTERDNDRLELDYEKLGGSSFSQTDNTTAEFGAGTLTGVTATSNTLVLSNMPNYNGFRAGFGNIAATNWVSYGGVYQETGYVRIQVDANTTAGGIRLFSVGVQPMTLDFYASTWGAGARHFIHCSTGSASLDQQITSLTGEGNWGWYRARYVSNTLYLYLNGSLIGSYALNTTNPTSNRVSFGIDTSAPGGFLIDSCYMAQSDLGAPDANTYNITGNRVSTYNVSAVTNVASSSISWDWTNETYTNNASLQNVGVEVSWDGSNWTAATSGSSIPIINPGDNLSGKTLYVRQILTANDPVFSPELNSLSISIDAGDNEYYSSGYRDSVTITAARPAARVGSTLFSWTDNKPPGTDVKAYTQVSLNAGSTWTDWAEVTNGGSIPDLPAGTDISQLSFRYRFSLSTSDPLVTPSVDRAEYKIFSGYKAEGYRISPPVSLDSLGIAGDSYIAWDTTPDASEDVIVETQLVNTGSPPNGSWTVATNMGTIPGITKGVTDLTGKELYVRQRLLSPDATATPQLHTLTWYVDGNVSNFIAYSDTEIGEMTIDSLPDYSFKDGFEDYSGTGWLTNGTVDQEDGFIRIDKPSAGSSTEIYIYRSDQALSGTYTIDFRTRTTTDWETFIFVADLAKRYDVALPNTNNEWRWMRLIVDDEEAWLYDYEGVEYPYGPYAPSSGGYYSLGFAIYDEGSGIIDVDSIYIAEEDLGAPTTTTWSSSATKQLDIGEIEIVSESAIEWDWAPTTATVDPSAQNATVETRVSTDGVNWSNWQPIPALISPIGSSVPIPDLPKNTELSASAKLEYRVTLLTSDPGSSPTVDHLTIYLESAIDNRVIEYEATAPSAPVIKISILEETDELEILHQETGNRILLSYPFESGDNVVVDCDKGKVMVNGQLQMGALSIFSDLADFKITQGRNTFIVTPMTAAFTEIEWRERWK